MQKSLKNENGMEISQYISKSYYSKSYKEAHAIVQTLFDHLNQTELCKNFKVPYYLIREIGEYSAYSTTKPCVNYQYCNKDCFQMPNNYYKDQKTNSVIDDTCCRECIDGNGLYSYFLNAEIIYQHESDQNLYKDQLLKFTKKYQDSFGMFINVNNYNVIDEMCQYMVSLAVQCKNCEFCNNRTYMTYQQMFNLPEQFVCDQCITGSGVYGLIQQSVFNQKSDKYHQKTMKKFKQIFVQLINVDVITNKWKIPMNVIKQIAEYSSFYKKKRCQNYRTCHNKVYSFNEKKNICDQCYQFNS